LVHDLVIDCLIVDVASACCVIAELGHKQRGSMDSPDFLPRMDMPVYGIASGGQVAQVLGPGMRRARSVPC
jgi:hypothetical protein